MEVTFSKPNPYATELYLHIVAGKMLFPNDQENFTSYLCLGIDDVMSMMIGDGIQLDKAFSATFKIVLKLFPHEPFPLSWQLHGYYLRNAHFPAEGKGSIEERIERGQFAGALLNYALIHDLSLTKAAQGFEEGWSQERAKISKNIGYDPVTITATNFMQNIWPEFKASAHLWAAYHDFSYTPHGDTLKFPFFRLSTLTELGEIVFPNQEGERISVPRTIWPSKYIGWRSFIYKSNHILAECTRRGNVKHSTKPLLMADQCWQFAIPNGESD